MNNVAVKKWIDALRSGDYTQCEGYLRIKDSHCVLGVLCDVHSKENQSECGWASIEGRLFYGYCGDEVGLVDEVEEWIGSDLMDSLQGADDDLILANDYGKYNFDKLANMIEDHAKELGYE